MTVDKNTLLLRHEFGGNSVLQRQSDGFINATEMCKACDKRWPDYFRLDAAKAFIDALSSDVQICASQLVESQKGNTVKFEQGTWVHPDIAIHLAQWLSPQFAVQVSRWVREWMIAGKNPVTPPAQTPILLPLDIDIRVKCEFVAADGAAKLLGLGDGSRIKMAHTICKTHGLSVDFLPNYTEEGVTQSLTALLKESGVGMSAKKVNEVLIQIGIIEIRTRASTKNPERTKEFKSLTEKGLTFGKNLINPNNQKETQPHFYADKFPDLLDMVNAHLKPKFTLVQGGVI